MKVGVLRGHALGKKGGPAGQIKTISAARVHVVLNNNYEDQGQRNARTLMGLVGRSRVTSADNASR